MNPQPISRRGLFSLPLGRQDGPPVDHEGYMAAVTARWEPGAEGFLRATEPLAATLCELAEVQPADRVLDAAAMDGGVALQAIGRGAEVSACDRSAGMVARGRARCPEARWQVADVDALPYGDAGFDTVVSALGGTLSSRPRSTARELLRVLRPGGLLVLAAFTPRSFTGRVMKMAEGRGPLPGGIRSPLEWGRQGIARARLEAAGDLELEEWLEHTLSMRFDSEVQAWTAFSGPFGLPEESRDRFADAIAAHSGSAAAVELQERLLMVRGRRLY